jgi:hypothetical protein
LLGRFSIGLPPRSRTRISKLAAAEFAKQMVHMPGVVHSSPPFPADTFQMAKTDDDFHLEYLHLFYVPTFCSAAPRCGSSNDFTLVVSSALILISRWYNFSFNSSHALSSTTDPGNNHFTICQGESLLTKRAFRTYSKEGCWDDLLGFATQCHDTDTAISDISAVAAKL